jgi:hemoglobin/transferrin/lactoferrin receptor protein
MKKIFIFFLLSSPFFAISQIITVLDKTSQNAIEHAVIHNESKSIAVATNSKGQADISALKGETTLIISRIGYKSLKINYDQLESQNFRVKLSEKIYDIDEVVISANKFEEKKSDVPQQIQVLTAKDLAFLNQSTSADVLQQSGNVLVQKSQLGGGSPIIRGFEANKVLMVVDGVRLNNAIYRGGHLQNVITMDNSILERTEVVFGPGSVIYGSDALGGVMHFHTKAALLADSNEYLKLKANAFTRYNTAMNEKTGHFDFNLGFKKVAFLTSATFSDFGDLRQGAIRNPFYGDFGKRIYYADRIDGKDTMLFNSNVNWQKFSGYKQYDLMEKILFKQSEKVNHVVNFQYSSSSNINRYDRLTDMSAGKLKNAQWYYGPQKRLLACYTLNLTGSNLFYNNARIIAGYQQIEESRNDRKFGKTILNHRIESVDVYTLNADFNKNVQEHEIRYGVEATFNNVESKANAENIETGALSALDTRYPDGGSAMQTKAAYVSHTWEISPKLILSEGLRYSDVILESKFNDKTFFPFTFNSVKQNSGALNGNIGIVYMPGGEWRFSALASSGFRAPNVDDLTKVFESVPGKVIVPNPNLKPEHTYNGELTIGKGFQERVKIEATGFYTRYVNALTTQSSTFQGNDSVFYNGVNSAVQTTFNKGEAYIYGFNAGLAADITDAFSIVSNINYTYGRIKTDSTDYPLDHIAPVFGKTSFNLKLNKFRGEFFLLYNGWKRLKDYNVVGEDNLAYATPLGTPAWYTLNLRSTYHFNKNIQLQMALENILDYNYRVFASGISAPGRNFSVTLRASF